MIPQISGGAGRAPAKKIEAAFGISLASLRSRFPLKIADGLLLSSGGTGPLGGIHLGLQHPAAQRLRADPFGPIAWQAAYSAGTHQDERAPFSPHAHAARPANAWTRSASFSQNEAASNPEWFNRTAASPSSVVQWFWMGAVHRRHRIGGTSGRRAAHVAPHFEKQRFLVKRGS
jgi:hypothetical protein